MNAKSLFFGLAVALAAPAVAGCADEESGDEGSDSNDSNNDSNDSNNDSNDSNNDSNDSNDSNNDSNDSNDSNNDSNDSDEAPECESPGDCDNIVCDCPSGPVNYRGCTFGMCDDESACQDVCADDSGESEGGSTSF